MAGQAVFLKPDEFTTEENYRVGACAPDSWGREWSYCMFLGGSSGRTFNAGEVLRDHGEASATASAASAIGSNILTDSGVFANKSWLRGAIGQITSATGVGQRFQVLRVLDNNRLEIAVLGGTGLRPGWTTALDNTSTYHLIFPGAVTKAAASGSILRGVIQARCVVPANEVRFGWALQKGDGIVRFDESGTNPGAAGTHLRTAANGLVIGGNAGSIIGYSAVGNVTDGTNDLTGVAFLTIENRALSYRQPIKDKPYSKDDDGNLVL